MKRHSAKPWKSNGGLHVCRKHLSVQWVKRKRGDYKAGGRAGATARVRAAGKIPGVETGADGFGQPVQRQSAGAEVSCVARDVCAELHAVCMDGVVVGVFIAPAAQLLSARWGCVINGSSSSSSPHPHLTGQTGPHQNPSG